MCSYDATRDCSCELESSKKKGQRKGTKRLALGEMSAAGHPPWSTGWTGWSDPLEQY